MTAEQKKLIETAQKSWATLKAAGFVQTCSWIAGIHSGSSWMHENGTIAEVLVKDGNLISYKKGPDVECRCGETYPTPEAADACKKCREYVN